jgi:serine/threonine protein kinase
MARDRLSPSRVRATAFRKTKATRNSSPEHSDAVPSGIGEKFETLESINSSTSTNHFRHDQCTPATNLDSLLLTSTALRTTLEGFVETLQLAGLSGPVTLIGKPQLIERGGQFAVYKREALFLGRDGFVHPLVAIKQPLFPLVDNQPTELANKSVQRNLKHVSNEIKALTNERLRYHPNIVELLSWAWEEDYNHPLVLVLELAHEDLEKALKSNDPPGFFLRVRFCNDVANGLDAIHEAKFVHGDLKPANVLIFFEAFRPVAKLADFGYSMEEGQGCNTGTAGWQAPEKEASIDADCFTFGLLVWSTLLLNGQIPTRRAELSWKDTAVTDLENRRSDISQEVFERILQSMTSVLAVDPGLRTRRLTTFFASTTELKANDE